MLAFFALPLVAGAAILRGSLDPGLVEHVKASQCDERDSHDVVQCVLESAENFWWQQQHRLQMGDAKAALLDAELRHQISTRQQTHASSSFVVVEFGTSDGYSTTRLARLMPEGSTLYVVEHEARRHAVAQEFLALSAKYLKPKIEFMHTRPSHAIDLLRRQGISADFVFLSKFEQDYVDILVRLQDAHMLHEGSSVIADNTDMGSPMVQTYLRTVREQPWMSYHLNNLPTGSMEVSRLSKVYFQQLASHRERPEDAGILHYTYDNSAENGLLDYLRRKNCSETEDHLKCVLENTDKYAWDEHWLMLIGDQKGPILDTLIMQKVAEYEHECEQGKRKDTPFVVVELGTYIGYSTSRMASLMPRNSTLYTMEFTKERQDVAKQLVAMAQPLPANVEFMLGKATDGIAKLGHMGVKADFVFIDHSKADYYASILKLESEGLLHQGSLVVADDIRFAAETSKNPMVATYISHTRGSGLYNTVAIEDLFSEYTSSEDAGHFPDSMEVSTYVAEAKCSKVDEGCSETRCCSTPNTRCFEKDSTWAACLESCPAGSADGSWTCAQLAHAAPEFAWTVKLQPGK